MDGLKKQSLTTCDELYRALKLHDRENIMYRITEDDFTIKLDEHHKINGYDSKGEVYLEIRMQGTQIMHWQLDYSEAYAGMYSLSGSAHFDGGGVCGRLCTSFSQERPKRKYLRVWKNFRYKTTGYFGMIFSLLS